MRFTGFFVQATSEEIGQVLHSATSTNVLKIKRRDLMKQELPDFQPRERDQLLDVIEGKTEGE